MTNRSIIHVDLDAFYASIEQRDDPALRGRPVLVGGSGSRGVVAAASYEARAYGVRSAMPSTRARRLCPQCVFLKPRFERYREVSVHIFRIFHSFTDQVEGLSLDEAFLDVSQRVAAGRSLTGIGLEIKRRIAGECGLTASVGMAHNKLLAKIASDYDKPDGFVHIRAENIRRYLDPLPVQRLWGVGPRSAQRLNDAGIHTAGQLRKSGPDVIERLFGTSGPDLQRRASGLDDRPVKPSRERRSISQETTLEADLHTLVALEPLVREQAEKIAAGLSARGLYARTVTIKVRSGGFATMTRSRTLDGYTRSQRIIAREALRMLGQWARWRRGFAVRLIGVGVSGLTDHPDETELLE